MRVLTSCRSGLEFCLHFFIEMTQRTGKVVIGDGFDKTLKLHFFQTGGHMGCLYEAQQMEMQKQQMEMQMQQQQQMF